MIYLKLEGHDFKYEIEDILKLFYHGEEIQIIDNSPPEGYRGIFLSCRIDKSELYDDYTKFLASVSLCDGNNAYNIDNEFFVLSSETIDGAEHEKRKKIKGELKRLTYKVLVKYTGKSMPWGILTGIRPAKIVHELLEKGLGKEEIVKKVNEHYFATKGKAELLFDVAQKERAILDRAPDNTVSIYIGIPFCTTRCLYCSFTSNSISKYSNMIKDYLKALRIEIEAVRRMLQDSNQKIQSIYIGGGTPTSIDSSHLEELLCDIEYYFDMKSVEEYTLEAGRPDSITEDRLKAIKDSRVSRISINPQTMNDDILKKIGRCHSSTDIINTFTLARELGFDNINMDVIAGLPGEDIISFKNTIDEIIKLSPESITVHTMAIKRASKLSEELERYTLLSDSDVFLMLDTAHKSITGVGLEPYYLYRQKNILGNLENIGYSKRGYECIYNIQIMEEKQSIIALGAGATTKIVYPHENRIERAFNVKSVEEYIGRIYEMIDRKRKLIQEMHI